MERPGGGRFLEVMGVLRPEPKGLSSEVRSPPSEGLAVFCSRDSIMCRCWSRTEMLRCNCSRILGSWVWKPGERQASPTSCIPRLPLSRAVNGADGREVIDADP